jgi:hypothetical protein
MAGSFFKRRILKGIYWDGLIQDRMVGQKKAIRSGPTLGQHFAINTPLFFGIYLSLLTRPIP